MTSLRAAALASQVVGALSALVLARRRPEHRAAAVALVLLAALVLVEVPLRAALAPLPRPVEGAARALVYLDSAAQLGTAAAVVGLAAAVCAEHGRRAVAIVAGAWLLTSVVLAALYPSPVVRGEGLRRLYLVADLGSLAAVGGLFALWARRARGRLSPSSAHGVALLLAFLDVAILVNPLGPYHAGLFGVPFDPVQATVLLGFVALAIVQGVLWRFSSR